MNRKSPDTACFYAPTAPSSGGRETFRPLPTTTSPWGPDSQHGGPPAALLGRALERLDEGAVGRFTMELLGPVPMGPLAVSAEVVRPGRTVRLAAAELYDVERDRPVAAARAWLVPAAPAETQRDLLPPTSQPADGEEHGFPPGWGGGYLDAIDWRWIGGAVMEPGPTQVWMRTPDLVAGEHISPLQRLLACADSASGASSVLDPRDWAFLNTELTLHVLRPAEGEWLLLDAETTLSTGSVGLATADIFDGRGLVARSNQALLVQRRPAQS
jgi:acyl-coenzyme A thioesterase PaaI-like protein